MEKIKFNKNKRNRGITLIALVITIIVLLILAGVGIASLTGDNGILKQANKAKEETEIAEEKEILELSIIKAMKYREFTKENLLEKLNENIGNGKVKVYNHDNELVVVFNENNRVYIVNDNGDIQLGNSDFFINDMTPGKFVGAGTKEDPYKIESVEDLVYFSQDTNNGNNYNGKYIKLEKNLNFRSELSYCNPNNTEYNGFLGVGDNISLLDALTNIEYSGFIPITQFQGNFDGNGKIIKNIYINKDENAGVFNALWGKIENLEIDGEIKGNGYVGGIVSSTSPNGNKIIENCKFNGKLENISTQQTYQGTGGIIGGTNGPTKIEGCNVRGEIKGITQIGGIVGYANSGSINKCRNEAILEGNDTIGGIIGKGRESVTIKNSYNIGNCISNEKAGGIVGHNCDEIFNCYNKGTIIGNNSSGLVNTYYFVTTTLNNSYNAGEVKNSENVEGSALINMVYPVSTGVTINNIFWQENSLKKWITSGQNYVTGESIMMTKEEMTSELLDKLNDYVKKYNEENKNNKDFVELVNWIKREDGYPTLEI